MAPIRAVNGDPSAAWEDVSWSEMNPAEQGLWGILGWDESSWEEDTDPPESDDCGWEDLSEKQQTALTQLGYTQALWDEE